MDKFDSVLVINGPSLNLLGTRQPEIYGHATLNDAKAACQRCLEKFGYKLLFEQSNHEGEIIDMIQAATASAVGIVINPAAYSHTSIAILDALNNFPRLVYEVHVSNIYKREEYRHHSYVSSRANGVIAGFGIRGYAIALEHLIESYGQ